jgi:hypothetical protein
VRPGPNRPTRLPWRAAAIGLTTFALLVTCGVGASFGATSAVSRNAVPAVRERLTTNPRSPVVHDNEVMALTPHAGRLFAATDQWEYSGPNAYGQVLVKDSSNGPWKVFEETQSTRVQALDSFPIPANQGLGAGHSLLVTQAIVHGHSEIQWLLDGASAFTPANSFTLPSVADEIRSFGAHQSNGVWSVYAGDDPTGVLRGIWSRTRHTLVFSSTPELVAKAPTAPGLKTQKVTAFADCGGSLYVTINTKLYRRNDGLLGSGGSRWVLVYQEPPVGALNSGLRGLSCITHDGSPSLLFSSEGSGDVFRIDHLPTGQLTTSGGTAGVAGGFTPVLEFSPIPALGAMLRSQGVAVPASGKGAINYVITAYNNFEPMVVGSAARQLFGLEWGYSGGCPSGRICAPSGFDAAACFAVRTDPPSSAESATYVLRCLSGPQFRPSTRQTSPVRNGQAFVSIRTITPSPFNSHRIFYAGFDNDFHASDGSAWVAWSTKSALRLSRPGTGTATGS